MRIDGITFVQAMQRAIGELEAPGGSLDRDGHGTTPSGVARDIAGVLQVLLPGIAIAHFQRLLVPSLVRAPRIELQVDAQRRVGVQIIALLLFASLEPGAPTVLRTATGRILTNVKVA